MRRLLPTLALMFCSTLPAFCRAEQLDKKEAFQSATTDWNLMTRRVEEGRTAVLFERGNTKERHSCRVRSVRPDSLLCARRFRRDEVIPRQMVLAILLPRDVSGEFVFPVWASTGGAIIAAGFFVGPAAPALWAIGGVVLLLSPAGGMATDGDTEHDSVLYFAPGPQPNLPLR